MTTQDKKSVLTLIYFMNHNQPRTVRIPIWKIKTALIIAAVAMVWIPVTAWMVPSLALDNSSFKEQIEEQKVLLTHEHKKNQKLFDVIARSVDRVEDTNTVSAAPLTKPETKKQINNIRPKIGIDGFQADSQHNQLDISFVQINKSRTGLSEGTFWAVAEFTTTDGNSIFISYPQGVIDDTGNTINPDLGKKFALRNQKQRQLSLHVPRELDGSFKKVKIGFQPNSGDSRSFSFSLDRLSMK